MLGGSTVRAFVCMCVHTCVLCPVHVCECVCEGEKTGPYTLTYAENPSGPGIGLIMSHFPSFHYSQCTC